MLYKYISSVAMLNESGAVAQYVEGFSFARSSFVISKEDGDHAGDTAGSI